MDAEKVVTALLNAAPGVTALVGVRIYPPPLPQAVALPAIAVKHISTVDQPTLDASAGYNLTQSRIEVEVIAKDYATQKTLTRQVRDAIRYQRGTIAGINVVSILRGGVGPDVRDDDMQIYSQSTDFILTLRES